MYKNKLEIKIRDVKYLEKQLIQKRSKEFINETKETIEFENTQIKKLSERIEDLEQNVYRELMIPFSHLGIGKIFGEKAL